MKLKGGPTGLSMRSKSPTKTQGTPRSPLKGVLEVSAWELTSKPGTSPLPVVRGGAERSQEKDLKSKGLREVAPPELRTPNPDPWSLEPRS